MDVSFSADQLRRVLGSAEGKQLLALLAARLASLASLALKNRGRGPGPKETP